MNYLTKDEFTLRISVEHLNEILAEATVATGLTSDQILNNAERWAQAHINSYLGARYDMTTEYGLGSTSADRNYVIMQLQMDLMLCTIHKTINPRDVPDHIAGACEQAQKMLEQFRDGGLILDIEPPIAVGDEIILSSTHLSSQQKFISKPYTDKSLFDAPETEVIPET
jgi:hypothetical protein